MNKIALLCLPALLALSSAAAQAVEPYIGFDAGRTQIKSGYGDDSNGWSLYGGLRLHSNVLAEAGYRRLGRASVGGVGVRGDALQASLIGLVPVGEAAWLFGRLGLNRVEVEARGNGFQAKEQETEALFGFGVEYSLSKNLVLRTEFQKPTDDSGVTSIGLRLRF